MKRNAAQQEAIVSTEGPLLIIAGPGSGKTYTLVERTIYLIREKGIRPEQLLIATFTEKAATELLTRISNRLLEEDIRVNISEMYIGTLHGICLRLIEEYREHSRLKRNFTVLDDFDQRFFIYAGLRDATAAIASLSALFSPNLSNWKKSEELQSIVNYLTEEYIDIEAVSRSNDSALRTVAEYYRWYQNALQEKNNVDFAGLQKETLELLRENKAVLDKVQSALRYLMIDEFQDTNTIQELILRELYAAHNNICVVGDDDQGLYRFRGATIRNILEFPDQFEAEACKIVKLETNYRSHPEIIQFYSDFMDDETWTSESKTFRHEKSIIPSEAIQFSETAAVLRVTGLSEHQWHKNVLRFIHELRNARQLTDYNQIAFLFRSLGGERVRNLIRFLESHEIPVYAPRSDFFFERDEIVLTLGLLLLLFPQWSKIRAWAPGAHLQIWDYYDDECLVAALDLLERPEHKDLKEYVRTKALTFNNLPTGTRGTNDNFSKILYELLAYEPFIDVLSNESQARNLAILTHILTRFEHYYRLSVFTPKNLNRVVVQLFNQFLRFLREGGINEYEDPEEAAPSGAVPFFTIHQSKGLEFPVVMVGSLGNVPRRESHELKQALQPYLLKRPFEPEERIKFFDWRRVFYTAFSRAQSVLVLTDVERTEGRGRHSPSRYMRPAFERALEWPSSGFVADSLNLAITRPAHLKRAYSFTGHITVYENCPRQYQFFRHWDFAPTRRGGMAFGQLIHQTIEDIHKFYLEQSTSPITEELIQNWFHTNYQLIILKDRTYLAEAVLDSAFGQVMAYYERSHERFSELREAEVNVSLVKDDYILIGSVDLIKGVDNTVEIVDFKGQNKPDLRETEQVERYRRQLEVYAHIVEEKFNWRVSRMHVYYTAETEGNPYLSFELQQSRIDATMGAFDSVVSRIENGNFAITQLPEDFCKNCDFSAYCKVRGID